MDIGPQAHLLIYLSCPGGFFGLYFMALNMSNPSVVRVMSIYSSILNNEYNWLLLHYTNYTYNELALHSYGAEGLEELKTRLPSLQEVFIAFYREEVDIDAGYVIINYIPSFLSAVKRARVLVHSRRVGIVFKRHQAIYTVDSLSLITSHNVHQAITKPDGAFSPLATNSPPKLADKPLPEHEHNSNIDPVPDYLESTFQPAYPAIQESPDIHVGNNTTRQSSSDYAPHLPVYAVSHVTDLLGGSFFKLLRRKKKKKDFAGEVESLPPQTPPKDNLRPILGTRSDIRPSRTDKILQHQRSRSISEFAVIGHVRDSEDMIVVQSEHRYSPHLRDIAQLHPLPVRGKWAQKSAIPTDPVERARQRRELELQKEREEQELVKEEAERQRRLKLEKEMILQQEKEEEAQRLAEIEQEISRIRLERRRREQSEKEEEDQQRRELEARKSHDRQRRLDQHQRAEEWRKQRAQKLEAAAHEATEIQRREEAKRSDKIQLAEAVVKQTMGERELTGWITMQKRDAVSWRRRYFKFVGTVMLLYRSAEDMITPLEKIDLRGNVGGLKEWYEGYEDLGAIAFSFVVEFKNGQEPLSMYADSEEEKYKLLGLLRVAAGL